MGGFYCLGLVASGCGFLYGVREWGMSPKPRVVCQ